MDTCSVAEMSATASWNWLGSKTVLTESVVWMILLFWFMSKAAAAEGCKAVAQTPGNH